MEERPSWMWGIPKTLEWFEMWKVEKEKTSFVCYKCERTHNEQVEVCVLCGRNAVIPRLEYLVFLLSGARNHLRREDPQWRKTWRKLFVHYNVDEEMKKVRIRMLS